MCSRNACSIGIVRCSGGSRRRKGISVSVVIFADLPGQLSIVVPAALALSTSVR